MRTFTYQLKTFDGALRTFKELLRISRIAEKICMEHQKTVFQIIPPMPFMSLERFCTQTGMSVSRAKKMVANAELPIIPRTTVRLSIMVDMVELYKRVNLGQFILGIEKQDTSL
ncbi:hypothetical protein JI57_04675 [Psychromonas sp. PRT-SC03]|nr:hypothetical protein JI57_04675 [Psychromonas sp. PRT-SC03]